MALHDLKLKGIQLNNSDIIDSITDTPNSNTPSRKTILTEKGTYQALSGYTGVGTMGASGYSGYSGFSGFNGVIGDLNPIGQTGKVAKSNGTNFIWGDNLSGSGISGYSGYSGYSGISGYSGQNGSSYPSQSGYSGYYLQSNGENSTPTWVSIAVAGNSNTVYSVSGTVFNGSSFYITHASDPYSTGYKRICNIYTRTLQDSLLLNMDSASFLDQTGKTVTNNNSVTTSATTFKFGTSSAYFNGTNYLSVANATDLNLSTGDFTIDCWVYIASLNGNYVLIDFSGNSYPTNTVYINYSGYLVWSLPSTGEIASSSAITVNAWNHIAITRNSSILKMFINGAVVYSGTVSDDLSLSNGVNIGYNSYMSDSSSVFYMDDFRLIKGYAKYTAAFSVPISAQTLSHTCTPIVNTSSSYVTYRLTSDTVTTFINTTGSSLSYFATVQI